MTLAAPSVHSPSMTNANADQPSDIAQIKAALKALGNPEIFAPRPKTGVRAEDFPGFKTKPKKVSLDALCMPVDLNEK